MRRVKIVLTVIAVLDMALFGYCGQGANTTLRCTTWTDPVLHVEFPQRLAGLQMRTRSVYNQGDDDYSLRYDSDESAGLESGGGHLDLYIFTYDHKPMPDGVNERVLEHLKGAAAAIVKANVYNNVKALGMICEGTLPTCGLKYYWTSHTLKFPKNEKSHVSVSLVFAWRNRFVKLRYSEPILRGRAEPCETLPKSLKDIAQALDGLIAGAIKASKVDVYSIDDPAKALAALRRKWLGVDEHVSMYDMPDYTEKFRKLAEYQAWCAFKRKERADVLEKVCRDGIRLKILPPIWYYNLACAHGIQGKREETISALERAVAAGYNEVDHARKDEDLALVWKDARFGKLMEMAACIKKDWCEPLETVRVSGDSVRLDERNIYWGFDDMSYSVHATGLNSNAIFYLDHNVAHRVPLVEDLIAVEYARELHEAGRDVGAANFHFIDVDRRCYAPTLLGCTASYKGSTNDARSVYARLCSSHEASGNEIRHLLKFNVLGVYGIADDYGRGGVDRLMAVFPGALAFHDSGDADDFVCLCADAYRAMSPAVREAGGIKQVIDLVRRGQKCVNSESDFMSGIAQRPALSIDDIDVRKMLRAARNMKEPYPDTPLIAEAKLDFKATPVSDLWVAPYDRPLMVRSPLHAGFVARWAEKTGKLLVKVRKDEGEFTWKVLQGDEAKIRFNKLPDVSEEGAQLEQMEIEVDYHPAFEVALPGGKKLKTSRVDIGCFHVVGGRASLPAVVSVLFMPAETREYDGNGRLVSIDYSKPQVADWLPWYCPKADFRDVFHWNKAGKLEGWTRTCADGTTRDFTKVGLVVQSRDRLGRPADVRRSLAMTWMQRLDPFVTAGKAFKAQWAAFGSQYDRDDGNPLELTLQWKYTYADDADTFGKSSPKPFRPFTYRPEICRRAEFTEGSGFRLPLVTQLGLGYGRYCNYKYDVDGLTPPKEIKKMRFCAWTPAADDGWKIDADSYEREYSQSLAELSDGVYRMKKKQERNDEEQAYYSVRDTYLYQHVMGEIDAYKKLDATYPRCDHKTIRRLMSAPAMRLNPKRVQVCDQEPVLLPDDLPKGIAQTIGAWKIAPTLYFVLVAEHRSEMGDRTYRFIETDEKTGHVSSVYTLTELPSRAIGNTILAARRGDPKALNNLAVLLYAEIVNAQDYDEDAVVRLLRRAMQGGEATAAYNLGVLYENRGEKDKVAALQSDGAAGASAPVTAIDWERAQTVQTGVKFVALDEVVNTPVTASDEKMLNLLKKAGRLIGKADAGDGRPMKSYLFRVDLRTPGLAFTATGRDAKWGEPMPVEGNGRGKNLKIATLREKTEDFLKALADPARGGDGRRLLVGFDTGPWRPWPPPSHFYADPAGLTISDGVVVTDHPTDRPCFVVWKDGKMDILESPVPAARRAEAWIAHTGFGLVLKDGQAAPPRPYEVKLMPRLALGLSKDRAYMYLLAIDGRQPGRSLGAVAADLVRLFRAAGAWDAIDFDGGGSATLCYWDAKASRPVTVNRTEGRRVALNVGVYVRKDRKP